VTDALLPAVLKDPAFLRLEASWRGLHYLVTQAAPDDLVKVLVLDARRGELARDLARDGAGQLFDLAAGGGDLGGNPCGLLVADYEFDLRRSDAIDLLRGFAELGSSLHAPVVGQAAPGSFGLARWSEVTALRTPDRPFAKSSTPGGHRSANRETRVSRR